MRDALCDTLDIAGYTVAAAGNGKEAVELLSNREIGLVISDVQMKPMDGYSLLNHIRSNRPDIPVLLMTAYGTIQKAVEAMRNGAVDYLVKPFDAERLIDTVAKYMALETLEDGVMVAVDERSRQIAELAQRVAGSDATVMISGESGTGKEVLARYIHLNSTRDEQPFVAINCAAIPDNMLEATLFGYEKGAFTGAYQSSPGKFEQAQGGTLLLDEVSEMALDLQAKLLRVLQEREVERLGGRKPITLDVRVLATSNRNLQEAVAAGRFREDLFYRLNVFPLHIPPIRERSADILPLAQRMLARGARLHARTVPELSEAARQRLLNHSWPGNVRELDNVIQRALILQAGDVIDEADLRIEPCPSSNSPEKGAPGAAPGAAPGDLKSRESQVIVETLRAVNGSRKSAAEKLGISQRTLRYKLARIREQGIAIPD